MELIARARETIARAQDVSDKIKPHRREVH